MDTKIVSKKRREEFHHRAHRGRRGVKIFSPLSSVFSVCSVVVLLPLAALCFTACPVEPETGAGGDLIEASLPIDGSGGRHYYDLSTGAEVTPAGDNWDLAREAHDGAFFVLTYSGDTAAVLGAKASGQGGVWFTDTTDFDAAASKEDRVLNPGWDLGDTAAYTVDQKRYVMVMAAEPV